MKPDLIIDRQHFAHSRILSAKQVISGAEADKPVWRKTPVSLSRDSMLADEFHERERQFSIASVVIKISLPVKVCQHPPHSPPFFFDEVV